MCLLVIRISSSFLTEMSFISFSWLMALTRICRTLFWLEVVKSAIFAFFLILEGNPSVFHHWVSVLLVSFSWKKKVKVAQSCPTLYDPMDYTVSPWNFPGQNTGVGSLSFLQGDLPNPGIEPRSLVLWADSLSAEPQEKPKNTGVGSLCLLQGIFPTQESNWGLLHCRRLLYQPSCEGSPISFSYMTFVMLLGSEFSCSG